MQTKFTPGNRPRLDCPSPMANVSRYAAIVPPQGLDMT